VPVDSDVCVVRWVHLVNSAKRRGGERKEPSVGRTPTTFINLQWNAHACCGAVRRVEADLQGGGLAQRLLCKIDREEERP